VHSPVSSQDYYASTNSAGTGSDLTANLSLSIATFAETAVVSIFNGSGTQAFLTRFQFRGYPVREVPGIGFKADVSSSQTAYGKKGIEITNALIQSHPFMRDLANAIVIDRSDPQEEVEATLVNKWPSLLSLETGQVIDLVNSLTGVNSSWTITSMEHDISMIDGLRHEARYVLDAFSARPYFVLDHATFGKLDGTRILAL
jgi:hypothetical protein